MHHDRRNRDGRPPGQASLRLLDLRIAGYKPEAMPVRVDDHLNEVRIFERGGGAVVRRRVEAPARRPKAPEQPAKVVAILVEPGPSALTVEVILVPELVLALRRLWVARARQMLDVVAAARDQPEHALRPQRGHDARRATAPIEAREQRPLDTERVRPRLRAWDCVSPAGR